MGKNSNTTLPPQTQPENATGDDGKIIDAIEKEYGEYIYVPYGITSFDALDAHVEAKETTRALRGYVEAFSQMSSNIMSMNNDPNFDKVAALETLTAEFIIRIGEVAKFDGESPDDLEAIESKAMKAGAKPRRKTLAERLGLKKGQPVVEKSLDSEPSKLDGLFIQKSLAGEYRWLLVYSNNFKDRVGDLITKEAHKNFVKGVESGEYPYPTVWHWHMPFTAWGKADKVGFDEETGMAWAEGYVMPGFESDAEAIMKSNEPIGVSHSMPRKFVVRDPDKPHHIIEYQSIEFSDLPVSKAANQLTFFTVRKDGEMPTQDQIEYLRKMGWAEEEIIGFGKKLTDKLTEGLMKGLERKDAGEAVTDTAEAAAQPIPSEVVAEVTDEVAAETAVTAETAPVTAEAVATDASETTPVTREEIVAGFKLMGEQVLQAVSAMLAPYQTALGELTTVVKEMAQVDEDKIVKAVAGVPTYSLNSLLQMNPITAENSKAALDGRSTLAKSAPQSDDAVSGSGVVGTLMSMVSGYGQGK